MKKENLSGVKTTSASTMLTSIVAIALFAFASQPAAAVTRDSIIFRMVPSAGAASCLSTTDPPHGRVTISKSGAVQNMHVEVFDLPPNTGFALFVIQVPNKPFGLVWYQGDMETDGVGHAVADVTGIFSVETFIMAPGVASAPKVFPDNATANPATPPIQLYHLGIWFADPAEAEKAGCPATVTPFDGDHSAGIQVLNTSQFADGNGPLRQLKP